MNKSIYTEKFKSILIVVLFLSTVLLSYLYWQDASLTGIKQTVGDHLSSSVFTSKDYPEPSSFVCPNSVSVNFGDGTFSLYQKEASQLWEEFLPIYIEFSQTPNLMIEKISREQWDETMSMKSIQYQLNCDLPSSFFEGLGAANYGQTDSFNNISVIAFSEASNTSLFVKENATDNYFRIISDSEFCTLGESIDKLKAAPHNQYYPISMYFGTKNVSLAPFQTDLSLPSLSSPRNTADQTENYEKDLAETFFGESLDFIRKIVDDNGTITYMYGYGQKMLTIRQNGIFEYQETPSYNEVFLNFDEALSLASSFIAHHGSWSDYEGNPLNLLLNSSASSENAKTSVYRFTFGTQYNNYPVYGGQESRIVIEITGNRITHYSRDIGLSEPVPIADASESSAENATVADILSYNYQNIATILLDNNVITPGDGTEDLFDIVVSGISSIDIGYFAHTANTQKIYTPAWVIHFSGFHLFYDLYSGQYIGHVDERIQ